MFEANSLSMKYHLRDLERQFTPKLGEYRPERTTPRFYPVATLLAFAIAALTVGAAYLA